MDIKVSPVFLKNSQSTKQIVVNQGGTRSGKTYSILQVLIICFAMRRSGLIIDIVRKTQAEIRDTVLTDFIEILQSLGLYARQNHNKTNLEYRLNGNLFRFIGLDKAQKKRGSKRDILYINEANGLTLEDWVQLSIRVSEKIFIDYNPSEYFWVNDQILEKDKSKFDFIHSTYLDNYDFLPYEQIKRIEDLILIDDFYYRVYVLGELAVMKGKIFNNYEKISSKEYDEVFADETFYGLDFGYVHATVLVQIKWAAETCYERCLYFESNKTDEDLLKFIEDSGIDYEAEIYADPAYPASIRKLRDAGFNVKKAKKDVKDGIRFTQALKRKIDEGSRDYLTQMGKYKFKQTADGKILEDPVKIDDDAPDAFRYGAYTHLRHIFNPMQV